MFSDLLLRNLVILWEGACVNNGFSTEQIIKIKEQLTKKLKEKDRLIKPKHGNLHLLWGIHEERHKRIQEQHNKNNIQDHKQYIQTIGI